MEQEYEKRNTEASSDVLEGYLSALFHFYVSGYYLDLKNAAYCAIGQETESHDLYHPAKSWSRMDDYIRNCIHADDQALITEVSGIDYIRDRLKREESYSIEVRDHGTGKERWYRFTVMRGADEDHAAISFTDVTNQVCQRLELESLKKSLEEKNRILEEKQTKLEGAVSEQEAQMEEITSLNHQLQNSRTELEQAFQASKESFEMLNRVHEVLGSAPWRIEYDETGGCVKAEFSDGMRRLFGYETEEDFPNSLEFWLSLVHPNDYDRMIKDVYQVLNSREQKIVTISSRYRAFRKDRTVRWYRVQGLVKRREDGSPKQAYGIILDITNLEEAEIGQKEALDAIESIHTALGSANWQMTFDESGKMTSCTWSDRFRRMLDYQSIDDFPNEFSSWTDLLHPADKKLTLNAYWAAANDRTGKTTYNIRYRLLTRTRGYRWYSAHGSLTRYENGAPKVYYGLFMDINEQVLTAQSQEANIREIITLNQQLEDNQTRLEEAAARQEAQIEEINQLNHALSGQKEDLERRLDAIQSLTKVYFAAYYLDLDKDTYYELTASDDIGSYMNFYQPIGKARETLNHTCDLMTSSGFRDAMKAFVDCSTLSERMRDTEEISIRLQLSTGDWARVRFIAGDRHPDRTLRSCTFVIRIINAEVAEEQKRNAELQKALAFARESAAEQEAQIEEITALNARLEENQTKLEESSAEQEAQLEEITALNAELEENQTKLEESSSEQEAQLEEITALNAELEANQTRLEESSAEQEAQLRKITALNSQLQENQAQLEKAAFRQDAQIEEITALNGQLRENQAKLEESAKQQEAQLAETIALNAQLQETKDQISEAYGMVEGLSSEYHTIWLVNKETLRMRLVRSNGRSTVRDAVAMAQKKVELDPTVKAYVASYVEPEDRERALREMSSKEVLRHLAEDKYGIYTVNYLRRDENGNVGYHQIAFANADSEDGKKQFVLAFRDIDKIVKAEMAQKQELEKAREAAEAANNAKTSFLFNMSHDIRTPMNAIMGFRDLLEKHQEDPDKRRDYLTKIQDASTVLLSIINNVLEMARIEKGTLEIDETAWSAEQFNDTLYSVFEEMMAQKHLRFTRQIEVKNHYVFCDPIKLREIFINLLSNAYKYTNAGGSVNMHLEEIPSGRKGWALYRTTISDTGIGMSEEFLPHIFEEFSREQNTTDAKVEGTGLGMPIVKRLVEMLDGTIEIHSKKGEGSSFIVTIPHRIADKNRLVSHAGVEIDPKLFCGKRILLAEDNDLNAEIAMEILGEAGFLVERAEDGIICVDMLQNAKAGYYDLILMDIQMPHMNGYEAARAIRTMDDQVKANTKILAMTANAFEEDKREALRAGMNGHLAKPINVGELMKTLAAVLG